MEHLARLEELAVQPAVAPGEVRALLPGAAPEHGEPFAAVLADLQRIVVPRVTQWQHPGFFAYFPGNASPPSMLADLVSSGLGVQGMLWSTGPAATEVEQHVLDWLVDLLDLPPAFRFDAAGGGAIQESASSATLVALLAARERATGGDTNARRDRPAARGVRLRARALVAGEGRAHRRPGQRSGCAWSPPMRRTRWTSPRLEAALKEDVAAGVTPVMVMATVGSTSSTAIDPVPAIGALCAREGVWLHVDGAYAGSAAICPELRFVNAGLELADSYAFNPHKWLLTNFDCTALYVRDRAALIDALSRGARVPAQPRHRVRRRRRLPRLADPPRPSLPRPQALVRPAQLRRRGPARAHPPARRLGALAGRPRRTSTRTWSWPRRRPSAWSACATAPATPRPRPCSTPPTPPAASSSPTPASTTASSPRVAIGGTFTEARHVADLWRVLSDAALR